MEKAGEKYYMQLKIKAGLKEMWSYKWFFRTFAILGVVLIIFILKTSEYANFMKPAGNTDPKRIAEIQYRNKLARYSRMTFMSFEHEKRKRRIQRACRRRPQKLIEQMNREARLNYHFDRNHSLFYCVIQKVASTYMKHNLDVLNGKLNDPKINGTIISKLNDEIVREDDEIFNEIQGSFKYLFVRDPYARAVSAYISKLYAPNSMTWNSIGKFSVTTFRKDGSDLSKSCGHDLTFPELVKYIIFSHKSGEKKNRHFFPMHEHCAPCRINYDFVGKLETLRNDTQYLFDIWNTKFGTNMRFTNSEIEMDKQHAIRLVKRLYNYRKKVSRCMTFHQGMLRVWRILQARGIISKYDEMPIPNESASNTSTEEFEQIVINSIDGITDIEAVKAQRQEAVIAAYRLVPMKDLKMLAQIYRLDCEMFGYDLYPPSIFDRSSDTSQIEFQYFDAV